MAKKKTKKKSTKKSKKKAATATKKKRKPKKALAGKANFAKAHERHQAMKKQLGVGGDIPWVKLEFGDTLIRKIGRAHV